MSVQVLDVLCSVKIAYQNVFYNELEVIPQFASQTEHSIDPQDINLLDLNFLITKCSVLVAEQIRRGYWLLAIRKVEM